jgi:hypothetical protein
LDAAAHAEDRDTVTQCSVEQIHFELIAIRVNTIGRGVDVVVPIACWIDIRTSAQKEAVDDRHKVIYGIALWWQNDRNAPCGFHGTHVRRRHAIAQESAVGERVVLC